MITKVSQILLQKILLLLVKEIFLSKQLLQRGQGYFLVKVRYITLFLKGLLSLIYENYYNLTQRNCNNSSCTIISMHYRRLNYNILLGMKWMDLNQNVVQSMWLTEQQMVLAIYFEPLFVMASLGLVLYHHGYINTLHMAASAFSRFILCCDTY